MNFHVEKCIYFVVMHRFLLNLDKIAILYLVYTNFSAKNKIKVVKVNNITLIDEVKIFFCLMKPVINETQTSLSSEINLNCLILHTY